MDLRLGMMKGMCDRRFYCAQSMQWVCKALKPSEATSSSPSITSQYDLQDQLCSFRALCCSIIKHIQDPSLHQRLTIIFLKNSILFKNILVLSGKIRGKQMLIVEHPVFEQSLKCVFIRSQKSRHVMNFSSSL